MSVPQHPHEAALRCFRCTAPMVRVSGLDTIEINGALRLDYRCTGCGQMMSYELAVVTITGYTLSAQQDEGNLVPLTKCPRCATLYDNRNKHSCAAKKFTLGDLFSY